MSATIWVLVIVISNYKIGTTVTTQEFNSVHQCTVAGELVVKSRKMPDNEYRTYQCIQK